MISRVQVVGPVIKSSARGHTDSCGRSVAVLPWNSKEVLRAGLGHESCKTIVSTP